MEFTDLWAVEYNPDEGIYHIDPLVKVLINNRLAINKGGDMPQYFLIGVCGSHDACHALVETHRKASVKHDSSRI